MVNLMSRPDPLDEAVDDDGQAKVDQQGVEDRDLEAHEQRMHEHAKAKEQGHDHQQGQHGVDTANAGHLVGEVSPEEGECKVRQIDLVEHAPRQAKAQSEQAVQTPDEKTAQDRLPEQLKAGK
jgi:hypothetical protein